MDIFVKLSENAGVWANKDKALDYFSKGYEIYQDETMQTQLSEEDLNAIVDTVGGESTSSPVSITWGDKHAGN